MPKKLVVVLVLFSIILQIKSQLNPVAPPYGQLHVNGTKLCGSNGQPVQLRGMSLNPWQEQYYTAQTVSFLKYSFNSNVVRAAMSTDGWGGYLTSSDNFAQWNQQMQTVIEAAINNGIYVIVDWHGTGTGYANNASNFFWGISSKYSQYPHIIYEIWNEPSNPYTWQDVTNYAYQVIWNIRYNDKNNVIVVGTPNWSQDVDVAAQAPIYGYNNIAYTLHYYAASHGQWLMDKATTAINKGLCLFITEYGTVNADGGGAINYTESWAWWNYADQNLLSYVNWDVGNGDGTVAGSGSGSSIFVNNTQPWQIWNSSFWSATGDMVHDKYQQTNQGLYG